MRFVGDVLITFGSDPGLAPTRLDSGGWLPADQTEASGLWYTDVSPGWNGFPFQSIILPNWCIYILGECYRPSPGFSAEIPPHQTVQQLNGRYLILAREQTSRRWHLWTDRFGTVHTYLLDKNPGSRISTSFAAVAGGSSRALDWEAINGFFGFGFYPADRTPFRDIRIFPPARHVEFDHRGRMVREQRYWTWRHEPNRTRSFEDTLAHYADLFGSVMADHMEPLGAGSERYGRVAVPISGGLDSRSTLVPLANLEKPPDRFWTYSYGYGPDSVETHIAGKLAETGNLPFQKYTLGTYLFDKIDELLDWTEGFQDITQPRQAFIRDDVQQQAGVLIGALWGDVWHDDMGLLGREADGQGTIEYALHKMEKAGRRWLFDRLAAPQLSGTRPEDLLLAFVRSEMAHLDHIEEPDFRVKAFKTEQWSFRWSLPPVRVFQSAAWPRLVFFDHRLTDFFCTVPTEYVRGRRLQIEHLKRFAPDLARVPWQVTGTDLFHIHHFKTWQVPKRALKKFGRLLAGQQIMERNWEAQFLNEAGRRGLEHWLLRDGLQLHEYVPPAEVRQLLADFYRTPLPEKWRAYSISMLLTFSAWLEKYA